MLVTSQRHMGEAPTGTVPQVVTNGPASDTTSSFWRMVAFSVTVSVASSLVLRFIFRDRP